MSGSVKPKRPRDDMPTAWFLQLMTLTLVINADMCGGAGEEGQCQDCGMVSLLLLANQIVEATGTCEHKIYTLAHQQGRKADCADLRVPPCKSNWFGSPCRYECHCVNNKCDMHGECTGTSICERGWFGPSCQYVDLVATNTTGSTPGWVYDYPDILCNTGDETVTVSLDDTFYFTWLRLRTNDTVSSKDFTLQLKSANGSPIECSNIYTFLVSGTLLDIHCQQGALFQTITITGTGVRSLCSVSVSGGRNVALGQDTTQTSDYLNTTGSWLAVDGDSDSEFVHGSCSHTALDDSIRSWTLNFERPHHVNRYVLYNRDSHQQRLREFHIEADQVNRSVAFTYTDQTNTNHDIYRIPSNTPLIPVSSVNIINTQTGAEVYLTLCEVEMFGDTVCPIGQYGRDCENRCNCAKSGEPCFVSTGGCPSGCAAGYNLESCQNACSEKYFGVDCLQKCSNNCTDQLCQPHNGTCLSCIPGKQGRLCDKACNVMYHGENCALSCSSNCSDQLCNATNGHCQSCLSGKSGVLCDEVVPVLGPDGCPPVGVIVGPVVAFVVLVTLIVIGVLIWRRYKHQHDEPEQTHRFHNANEIESIQIAESNTVSTKTDKAATGHAKPSEMKIPSDTQDNMEIHQHNVGNGYYNCVPIISETSVNFSGQDSSMVEHRRKYYQQGFSGFPTRSSSTTAATLSSQNQNYHEDKHISAGKVYEIAMNSTAVTEKSRQPISEDHVLYANETVINNCNRIDDTVNNPYEEIHVYS